MPGPESRRHQQELDRLARRMNWQRLRFGAWSTGLFIVQIAAGYPWSYQAVRRRSFDRKEFDDLEELLVYVRCHEAMEALA